MLLKVVLGFVEIFFFYMYWYVNFIVIVLYQYVYVIFKHLLAVKLICIAVWSNVQIIILDTEFIMRKLCIDCNILSLQFPVKKSINILIKSIVLICIFIEHQVILRCTLIACSQGRESSYLSPTCYCLLYTSSIIESSIHATSVTSLLKLFMQCARTSFNVLNKRVAWKVILYALLAVVSAVITYKIF